MSDALQTVIFSIHGSRVEAQYDRSLLSLGAIVHVDGASGFAPAPSHTSVPHAVTWISPSDWSVRLTPGYRLDQSLIDGVFDATAAEISKDTIKQACENVAARLKLDRLYTTREVADGPLGRMRMVWERIALANRLAQEQVSEPLWHHYTSLVTYLMLTCFDALGQRSGRQDGWLQSSDARSERQDALAAWNSADGIDAALLLHKRWGALYGVRNSFFAFIDDLLPDDARAELMDSFKLVILTNPPEMHEREGDDAEKKKWLYELRNAYTHRVEFMPGHANPSHPDAHRMFSISSQEFRKSDWVTPMTRNWPSIFIKSVRRGLAAYVRRLA